LYHLGVNRPDIYLIDVFRKRLNFPDLKRAVIELRHRFRLHIVLVEDKASGTQLIQELKGDCPSVRPYLPPAGTDKLMRLYSQTRISRMAASFCGDQHLGSTNILPN
jgi:phage terminase large subunit-like protein